jgi:GNAT superfamily N-acetyltransferase
MEPLIVALDHPSLDGLVATFMAELRSEARRFGPRSMRSPKPFPSLIDKLERGAPVRLAAVHDGRVIGVATVSDVGEIAVAVVGDRRRCGVGRSLIAAAIDRARMSGHGRLVLYSSRRSAAMTSLASQLGWIVVDQGRGRLDLIIDLTRHTRIA